MGKQGARHGCKALIGFTNYAKHSTFLYSRCVKFSVARNQSLRVLACSTVRQCRFLLTVNKSSVFIQLSVLFDRINRRLLIACSNCTECSVRGKL